MSAKTSSDLKPAQVMVSELDREVQRRLRRRLLDLGVDSAGPTALYRAGLRALVEADDTSLIRAIDQAEERLDPAVLKCRFDEWCDAIASLIANDEPELKHAYQAPGSFSNQGRFVALSLMHDGRVLIGGLAAVFSPKQSGHSVPRVPVLFPGGLATMVSMDDPGAELAKRAIVVWLLGRDDELDAVRNAFRAHSPQPLRK